MLFIVGLISHVIATSTARIQVSFQLGSCSKCPPLLWGTHEDRWKLSAFHKVHLVQRLHFTGEVDTFALRSSDV